MKHLAEPRRENVTGHVVGVVGTGSGIGAAAAADHVSSIAGKEGNPGMVSYSTSNAEMIGMVKSMEKECAGTGVTVNALAPAVIETPLNAATPQAQLDYIIQRIPMGRLGTLQETADAIAWTVSPATSFTTGFTFNPSGGRATL